MYYRGKRSKSNLRVVERMTYEGKKFKVQVRRSFLFFKYWDDHGEIFPNRHGGLYLRVTWFDTIDQAMIEAEKVRRVEGTYKERYHYV